MDHQQLATKMVCSWGLVKAYQQTRQSTYICPPVAPCDRGPSTIRLIMTATRSEGTQECVVLQYAHALQYVSYCNDERYRDHVAPAVKAFWGEVAQPLWQ